MRQFTIGCWLVVALLATSFAQAAPEKKEKEAANEVTLAHIELHGNYPEGPQLPGLFGDIHETLANGVARLDKAANDPKVVGVILRLNEPEFGWGKMETFREAIARVRAKGKKVICYLEGGTNMHYLLATACNEIVMPDSGMLLVVGLRAEVTFYKKLFDLLGVKADMLRVGEFKSAGEPYTRTEMSPEFRKEMEEIVDDYYAQIVDVISKSRRMTPEQARAAIDAGPQTARKAKELGLIDRIAYQDEIEFSIRDEYKDKTVNIVRGYGRKKLDADFSGFAGMIKFMDMLTGTEQVKRPTKTPKIAVIYATGPIMTGRSKSDMFSGETSLGSDTLIKAIREANRDTTVKAIVLRVNSPGGSALASDLMWRELEIIKKPFIASMGDVAASGGYYISMGADKIFAEPGTLTGSIGVVGGKLALEGLYGKIGITTSVITRGKNAGVLSSNSPFTDEERASMQQMLNEVYDQFTGKAAEGRKMDKAKLEKLARGRVYTGRMAVKLNLVDELGSLEDAVAEAKKLANLGENEKVERLTLPKPTSPFEHLFGPIDASPDIKAGLLRDVLNSISPDLARNMRALDIMTLMARERVLMVLPFRFELK